ncbi:hypothetical protein CSA57_13665 [candidate division KSB3 bacterium]|nr:MAG: hypothetical protein CSA57_13665 [candidate division KSB3 bacterium]
MKLLEFLFLAMLSGVAGCNGGVSDPSEDPNFTIIANSDSGFELFNRKVEVFNIPIYAVPSTVDNPLVIHQMLAANAFMFMWKNESDLNNINPPDNAEGQDLGNDETLPAWHKNGHTGQFDAALEEVWHIITHAGYAKAYPSIFGENTGSALADAMDRARGGQFMEIPDQYPSGAWYTYNDQTCDYSCMVAEYFYWAMSSMLGAQENRLSEIEQEWKLNTKALVQAKDLVVFLTPLPQNMHRKLAVHGCISGRS